MIYKFIDDNDSEITVNSLSSLQSLVDSETIKEETKVKAGLRGKWTSASKIKELVFPKDEIQETEEPKEDIKSFITKEKPKEEVIETPKEEVIETPKEEVIETPKEKVIETPKEEVEELTNNKMKVLWILQIIIQKFSLKKIIMKKRQTKMKRKRRC